MCFVDIQEEVLEIQVVRMGRVVCLGRGVLLRQARVGRRQDVDMDGIAHHMDA